MKSKDKETLGIEETTFFVWGFLKNVQNNELSCSSWIYQNHLLGVILRHDCTFWSNPKVAKSLDMKDPTKELRMETEREKTISVIQIKCKIKSTKFQNKDSFDSNLVEGRHFARVS